MPPHALPLRRLAVGGTLLAPGSHVAWASCAGASASSASGGASPPPRHAVDPGRRPRRCIRIGRSSQSSQRLYFTAADAVAIPNPPGPGTQPEIKPPPPPPPQPQPQPPPPRERQAGRARSTANRQPPFPPLQLPQWFSARCVTLLEQSPRRQYRDPDPTLSMSRQDARELVQAHHGRQVNALSLKAGDSVELAQTLRHDRQGVSHQVLLNAQRALVMHAWALVVALAYQVGNGLQIDPVGTLGGRSIQTVDPDRRHLRVPPDVDGAHVLGPAHVRVCRAYRACADDDARSAAMTRGMAALHALDCESDILRAEGFAAALAAGLDLAIPGKERPGWRRPVPVLAVTGYTGCMAARAVVERAAESVDADVVHLDTGALAEIIGGYMGQDCYARRGPFATLGYRVAEISGRVAPRSPSPPPWRGPEQESEPEEEEEPGQDSSQVPDLGGSQGALVPSGSMAYTLSLSQLRAALSSDVKHADRGLDLGDPPSSPTRTDGRWEGLKLAHALEQLAEAADRKRAASPHPMSCPGAGRRTVIHVQDFVEMSEVDEGALLIAKLRTVADRLVDAGRQVVLVGSTSRVVDWHARSWLDRISQLSELDCHFFPHTLDTDVQSDDGSVSTGALLIGLERAHSNLSNLNAMVDAMLGTEASITSPILPALDTAPELSHHFFDMHWAYSLASLMVGRRSPPGTRYRFVDVTAAQQTQRREARAWKRVSGSLIEPYFWPLSTSQSLPAPAPAQPPIVRSPWGSLSPSPMLPSSFHLPEVVKILVKQQDRSEQRKEAPDHEKSRKKLLDSLDEHEMQLVPGIVHAADVKTTWDQVVCAAATKESLMALTSLSLARPDAFSYGVLATERIQGCLLYGPPGTGKTLMARAIAKQSGANMLEITGASIHERWVGSSERNVRAVFSLARKLSPAVIFLDEADSVLGHRQNSMHAAHREAVNQFLREWDGLTGTSALVIVATNQPFALDEAVLRRLPRRILVDLPLRSERLAILRVLLRGETLLQPEPSGSVGSGSGAQSLLESLASETELYSGSDLKNLCVAAAMEAVKDEVRARDASPDPAAHVFPERRVLTRAHFDRALREIGSSVSADAASLKSLRTFDERYGDSRADRGARSRHKTMGFGVVAPESHSGEARVRQSLPAA